MRSLNDLLKDRRSPTGRRFERRNIKVDCNNLIAGAIGLANSWVLVATAIAQLIVSFIGCLSTAR